jgi:small subunit ribosomal protein S9
MDIINKIGRRKASVARIYISSGTGQITVNGKDYKEYFPMTYMQYNLENPLKLANSSNIYDVRVNVNGGGYKGQAEAIRLAISRAMVELNEESKGTLKEHKYLMRDARVVERKKYGKAKARKSFQFSKR